MREQTEGIDAASMTMDRINRSTPIQQRNSTTAEPDAEQRQPVRPRVVDERFTGLASRAPVSHRHAGLRRAEDETGNPSSSFGGRAGSRSPQVDWPQASAQSSQALYHWNPPETDGFGLDLGLPSSTPGGEEVHSGIRELFQSEIYQALTGLAAWSDIELPTQASGSSAKRQRLLASDTELIDVFAQMSDVLGLEDRTIRDRAVILRRFARELVRTNPEDSLGAYLVRYESPVDGLRDAALKQADFARGVGNVQTGRRKYSSLINALDILASVPPEERHALPPVGKRKSARQTSAAAPGEARPVAMMPMAGEAGIDGRTAAALQELRATLSLSTQEAPQPRQTTQSWRRSNAPAPLDPAEWSLGLLSNPARGGEVQSAHRPEPHEMRATLSLSRQEATQSWQLSNVPDPLDPAEWSLGLLSHPAHGEEVQSTHRPEPHETRATRSLSIQEAAQSWRLSNVPDPLDPAEWSLGLLSHPARGEEVQSAYRPVLQGLAVGLDQPANPSRGEEVFSADRAAQESPAPAEAVSRAGSPGPQPAARSAQAIEPGAAMRYHRARLDDADLIDHVYPRASEAIGKTGMAVKRRQIYLRGFVRALVRQNPEDSLKAFLVRYGSTNAAVQAEARQQFENHVLEVGGTQVRGHVGDGLQMLLAVPAEEDHGSARESDGRSRAKSHLRTLLPPQDQTLVSQVEASLRRTPRSGLPASHAGPALVQFADALMRQGHGGLTNWLDMLRDGKTQLAGRLLTEYAEAHPSGLPARQCLYRSALHLQEMAGLDAGHRAHIDWSPRMRGRARVPSAPTDTALIDGLLGSLSDKAANTRDKRAAYRRELSHFGTWLRQEGHDGRPAYPNGLHDLLDLERAGERERIEQLRDQFLGTLIGEATTLRNRRWPLKAGLIALLRCHADQPPIVQAQPGEVAGAAPHQRAAPLRAGPRPNPETPQETRARPPLSTQESTREQASRSLQISNLPQLQDSAEWSLGLLPRSPRGEEVQSGLRPVQSDARATSVSWGQPVAPARPAMEIDSVMMAMTRLRSARQHGAVETIHDTAMALGLDAGRLAEYVGAAGDLRNTPAVHEWLWSLPREQCAALLNFMEPGEEGSA